MFKTNVDQFAGDAFREIIGRIFPFASYDSPGCFYGFIYFGLLTLQRSALLIAAAQFVQLFFPCLAVFQHLFHRCSIFSFERLIGGQPVVEPLHAFRAGIDIGDGVLDRAHNLLHRSDRLFQFVVPLLCLGYKFNQTVETLLRGDQPIECAPFGFCQGIDRAVGQLDDLLRMGNHAVLIDYLGLFFDR